MTPEQLEQFHAGDSRLFQSLVEELSPRLLGYTINLTGDRDDASDLLQETWIQAYRRRATYRAEGPLLGWLITMAYHRFASDRRGEARRLARQAEAVLIMEQAGSAARVIADATDTDVHRSLAAALAELPERQRAVVVCRLLEDRSVRETASLLGIAEGTVKAALHHAIRKLRTLLRESKSWKAV